MNVHRLFKENEHQKIGNELLNKLIPMDVLNSYYLFGYAEALASINEIIDHSMYKDSETREFITELINTINNQSPEIKSYYDRIKDR